ncbi:MAG: sodium ion-translocating decarboxylase subunit beta, partial [Rhodospirillaceae bacterium]
MSDLTGFDDVTWKMVVMWAVCAVMFYLAVVKEFEPLLLVPIAFGAFLANLPCENMWTAPEVINGEHIPGGLYWYISQGIHLELFPPIIFLGV